MKGSILLLDDNPVDLKVAGAVLTHEGYDCAPFTETGAALEWLKEHQPRMIFLDLQMPGTSGFDLIPVMTKLTEAQETLLVIMSGQNREADIRRAISLGARDYVIKPVDPLVLVDKIKKIEAKNESFFEASTLGEAFSSTLIARSFQITGLSEFGVSGLSETPMDVGEVLTLPSLPVTLFPDGRALVRVLACDQMPAGFQCKFTFVGLSETVRQNLRVFCRTLWLKNKERAS